MPRTAPVPMVADEFTGSDLGFEELEGMNTAELAQHRATTTYQQEVVPMEDIENDLMLMAHLGIDICGYDGLEGLHIGWMQRLLECKKLLFLAPRSHFKTTCISVLYPLYRIVKDPSVRILIINEILDNAKGFLLEIKTHLQSRALKEEFGNLTADALKWSETTITLSSKRISKDPTIGVAGSLGTIVSRHCDLIIVDDPVSLKNSQTTQQRQKLLRWFLETLTPILEPDGQIIVTGTRWHHDDLYGEILKKDKFTQWTKVVLAAEWDDPDGTHRILFPERFSPSYLKELREDMGEAFYDSQYKNDPSKLEGHKFKLDWLKFYKTPPESMRVYQGVDLAISKSDQAAYFAIVTIGVPVEGDIYILDILREHIDFPSQLKAIKSTIRRIPPLMVGIENNAYQEAMPQWLRSDPDVKRFPIQSIPTHAEKIRKLTTLAPLFEQGIIKVREDMHAFIDEYLDFPVKGTFDILDALFNAIQISNDREVEPQITEVSL